MTLRIPPSGSHTSGNWSFDLVSSCPQPKSVCLLLVDDDELVLRSLRRALSGQGWTIVTAGDAQQALRELESHPVDVVMTDMQMQAMSGATLLGAVQQRHPDVVRIIISGHPDPGHTLKALPFAHQFLPKPIETDLLRWTIRRACGLRRLLTSPAIRGAVGAGSELPAAPATYLKIQQVLRDPDASVAEVAAVVEQDAGISARLLQLVSSAFFDAPRRVTTIAAAVSYLGIQTLRVLVLSLEIVQIFRGGPGVHGLSAEALQEHSLATARLARGIAGEHAAEDAYVAGMLHALGRLVLAARVPERYAEVMSRATSDPRSLFEAEREILGATHAQVGGYLLGLWGLPQRIVEAVTHHADPGRVDTTSLGIAGAVYVASVLASDPDAPLASARNAASGPWLDLGYLESTGALSGLPAWRALARRAPL